MQLRASKLIALEGAISICMGKTGRVDEFYTKEMKGQLE